MKHIVSFSGGKDSTALILWAKENLESFTAVYCDTKWEHPLTYIYLEEINNKLLDGKLVYISSKKYDGFEDLSIKRKRVPSAKARFCTEELKIIPMVDYLKTIDGEKIVYQGIRADESIRRSQMADEGFDETYNCMVKRPLFRWTALDCFAIMQKHGVEPNPLYKMGARRVGCMPCVMVNKKELLQIIIRNPEVIEKIKALEDKLGSTFFPPQYIPDRFCSNFAMVTVPIFDEDGNKTEITKQEKRYYPTVDEVVKYMTDKNNKDQIDMFVSDEDDQCMSYYGLCGI